VSSLKCQELGLNEDEPAKKSKSISLKSKGKSSKAPKDDESNEDFHDEGSKEDPEPEEIVMISKRL